MLRAPALGASLSQDIIRDCYNQFVERRQWSWLQKHSAFYPPSITVTGTVSLTSGSNTVTGSGTNFADTMIGKQFRVGSPAVNYPTYTILQYISATSVILDAPWTGPDISGQVFQVFQCYFPVPQDFKSFYSLVNLTNNYRLWTNLTQAELDMADPQRVQIGITYAAAFYDYTQNYNGIISPTLQVRGTGTSPVSGTSTGYLFPANSIYTVEITTGGDSGAAVFKWKQDAGSYTTGVTTDTNAIELSNGVAVYFPSGLYVVGDVFVIQCTALAVPAVPRYEFWPRPINTPYVYSYLYTTKNPPLTDADPQLPAMIANRGDVILEMALTQAAQFPGTDTMRNPYYNLTLAAQHGQKAESLIYEMEKKDDEVGIKDLTYQQYLAYPCPFLDGSFLQSHAIYPRP